MRLLKKISMIFLLCVIPFGGLGCDPGEEESETSLSQQKQNGKGEDSNENSVNSCQLTIKFVLPPVVDCENFEWFSIAFDNGYYHSDTDVQTCGPVEEYGNFYDGVSFNFLVESEKLYSLQVLGSYQLENDGYYVTDHKTQVAVDCEEGTSYKLIYFLKKLKANQPQNSPSQSQNSSSCKEDETNNIDLHKCEDISWSRLPTRGCSGYTKNTIGAIRYIYEGSLKPCSRYNNETECTKQFDCIWE